MNEGIVSDILQSRIASLKQITKHFSSMYVTPPKGLSLSVVNRYLINAKSAIEDSARLEYLKEMPIDNYYKSSVILNLATKAAKYKSLSDSDKLLFLYQISVYVRMAQFMISINKQGNTQEVNFVYDPYQYRLMLLESIELDEKDYAKLVIILMRIMKLEED